MARPQYLAKPHCAWPYHGVSDVKPTVTPALFDVCRKLLASFGTAAVAAWALGSRFEFFALVAVLAMTMSLPPMIGRMLGAKEITHIRQLVRIACQFVLGFQLLIALVTYVLPHR